MAKVMFGYEPQQKGGSPPAKETAASLSWLSVLPPHLRKLAEESLGPLLSDTEEVRLRIDRPIIFRAGKVEATASQERRLTDEFRRGYVVTRADLEKTVNTICQSSFYAWESGAKRIP